MSLISNIDEYRDIIDDIMYDDLSYKLGPDSITVGDNEYSISEDLSESVKYDPFIYGKSPELGIVSIEVKDDTVYKFYNNGTMETEPAKFWFLTNKEAKDTKKLKGNLFYNYISVFDNYKQYNERKSKYYQFRKPIHNITSVVEQIMTARGYTLFKGLKVDQVSALSFDIEANTLISSDNKTPVMGKDTQVYIITNTFRSRSGEIEKKLFSLDNYSNQTDMIEDWCAWVTDKDPSILLGHNVFGYDFPVLEYVYSLTKKKSLPLGKEGEDIVFSPKTRKFRKDQQQHYDYYDISCFGRHIIDTMFLAIKYDVKRNYNSYRLKDIISLEGLEKEDRQFYDAVKIKDNWDNPTEREKIKKYCLDDGDDALALYDLMISSFFYYTQSIPMTFQAINNSATGRQINSFLVRSYIQKFHSIPKDTKQDGFEGAISLGSPGYYENVCKVDVASLYPSIIRTYNIYDKKKDPHKHFLKMVDFFTEERLKNKEIGKTSRHHYDLEQAQKIVINSAYGLMGTNGLNFNSPDNAALTTRKGREILQKGISWASGQKFVQVPRKTKTGKIIKKTNSTEPKLEWVLEGDITGKGYHIVNVDTDSFSYVTNNKVSKTEFDKQIVELNSLYPDGIIWEDDGRYEQVLVIKAKNYVLNKDGKIKYKGSSISDAKKEPALRELLNQMISGLLLKKDTNHFIDIYNSYIQEAFSVKDINRWATKKTVTRSVLDKTTTAQTKVFNAIDGRGYREGDKVWVYQSVDGTEPVKIKGEIQKYKDGRVKTKQKTILRTVDEWDGNIDSMHLVNRIYSTVRILENVLDISSFIDYTKKANNEKLKDLLSVTIGEADLETN